MQKSFFFCTFALEFGEIPHYIKRLIQILQIMNKSELVAAVAEKAGMTKVAAAAAIDAALETLVETVKKGEEISLVGYATIKVAQTKARTAKNPRTGAVVNVPAKKVVRIKPGAKLAL